MRLYLKLCVELRESIAAKDGLYQYRKICKDVDLESFQRVIKEFLDQAKRKAAEARESSTQTVLDIEDLDVVQTPER